MDAQPVAVGCSDWLDRWRGCSLTEQMFHDARGMKRKVVRDVWTESSAPAGIRSTCITVWDERDLKLFMYARHPHCVATEIAGCGVAMPKEIRDCKLHGCRLATGEHDVALLREG